LDSRTLLFSEGRFLVKLFLVRCPYLRPSSENVRPRPGSIHALRGVELAIGTGELVAILGRSGNGKSTLLNMVAGIDKPSAGNISVAGGIARRQRLHVPSRPRRSPGSTSTRAAATTTAASRTLKCDVLVVLQSVDEHTGFWPFREVNARPIRSYPAEVPQ
jgi:ABC-type dipeptide/oligopeptide/nickel transport system ATPase subunit